MNRQNSDDLAKIEKEIENKIKVPEKEKTGEKFVVDVAKLKKLAERLNEYETQSDVAPQH
jgi:hypothetical protein